MGLLPVLLSSGTQLHDLALFVKNDFSGAPGWRSRLSVRPQPGHDLAVREFEPRVRLWAVARSLEPVSDSVSPSLSAPPPFMLSLCPKNKFKKTLKKNDFSSVANSQAQ